MLKRYWIFIPFALVVALLGAGLFSNPKDMPSALVGKPVPAFALPSLMEPQRQITPADFEGQVWVLNVWASWCVPCQLEHDVFLQQKLPEGVAFVGLNYKDDAQDAVEWLRRMGGNPYQTIIQDMKGRLGMDLGVYGVPETFIINRQGQVVHRFSGAINDTMFRDELIPKVKEVQKS